MLIAHQHPCDVSQQEVDPLLGQDEQAFEGKGAQIGNPQASLGHRLLLEGTATFMGSSRLQIRTGKPSREQGRAHRQLEAGFAGTAPTAPADRFEDGRHTNRTAIFHKDVTFRVATREY